MQVHEHVVLLEAGRFPGTGECREIVEVVKRSIRETDWPPGSRSFTLYDEPGKESGKGNGVKPIKELFMAKLKAAGWSRETKVDIATLKTPGPLDATTRCQNGKLFCVEWETGNISSSHRALNKMAIGLLHGVLAGGILILPTRAMYKYLTDRVGNYSEIAPYFPMWRALPIEEGYLAVIAVEHDGVSKRVPRFPKGTDGRALV